MSQTPSISHVGFATTAGIGDLNHLEASLARIVELGADVAELGLCSEDLIAGGRVLEARARRLADICAKFPLRYTVHGLIVSNFMDARNLEFQKAAAAAMLELCSRVGSTILVHHAGHAPMGPKRILVGYDQMQQDALTWLADLAGKHGVRVALENIFAVNDDEYRQMPSEVADTIRAINHPNLVGTIDFSHGYIETTRTGANFIDEMKAMGPVAGHLHVHDSFGRPYTMTKFYQPSEAVALGIGDLHLPLGWGDIPWETLFDTIDVLPGTALIMEIGERFDADRAESIERARKLADRINARHAAIAA
ncbi:TIM barrel protein [Kaistia dalseonensis]|uniref:Sugar phosphate isomerase/epimerase n=1 Tax=Kaistia dalseonensis TaxID=410840 RepID=A0ABU0HDD0_9HYPH|nr:TIM barrel protein [Kaistia dalseonensis]MCX5497682.1 TIM barrel protein [Kaistia dalseonensis]MDQ0440326.1 sugar phosphate isomerase/epimerase [Kaistia dalseonensis]